VAIPPQIVREFSLRAPMGVEIVGVVSGSPAHRAGLQRGDILVGIEGKVIASVDTIHRILNRDIIGRPLTFVILRSWELQQTTVVPEASPPSA